jgi:diadenosine tetraphosphatase ApaH/serine/threonine PP2A family protein phosphatase
MRTLLFSDVHGNLEALEAVIVDASKRGFDKAICLGDIVGYGADPEACVTVIASMPRTASVLGNHDLAVIDSGGRAYLNPVAQAGVRYSEKVLSWKSIDYLKTLPLTVDSEEGFVACHASPYRPGDWLYVLEPVEAREALQAMLRPVAFIGHTHFPLVHDGVGRVIPVVAGEAIKIRPREMFIINVGSVGQPRDGDARAAYAILDPADRVVWIFRVEYDVDTTARKILDAGLPEMLADRIRRGY